MAKTKSKFVCRECGYESVKWLGRCPSCGTFNSMEEELLVPAVPVRGTAIPGGYPPALPLTISSEEEMRDEEDRLTTGMSELDRVFGGGLVRGSVTLLGGDPGIGKSTILLQACQSIARQGRVLYVSGEESRRQIRLRASRLKVSSPDVLLLTNTELATVEHAIEKERPSVVIIDSIQTMFSSQLNSLPGTVSQIKECANALIMLAKTQEICFLFIGHMNKEGSIAGPKMLEHMVDTVLYFEGDKNLTYRIIRAAKNRFGSTNEIGIFEMGEEGLEEVENPSAALLSGRPHEVPGTCTVCVLEGTRPILAEVQALLSESSFTSPRRMATGIEQNRAAMLLAVMEKHLSLRMSAIDAYCNVVGGLRLSEPSSDLAVVLAAASSYLNRPVQENLVAFGEVGLAGELRSVRGVSTRIAEAVRLGYTSFVIPHTDRPKTPIEGATIYAVKNIAEALEIALAPQEQKRERR
ncbi:MAG: DNA repair protein RadA [Clostridia bacterium]|nr:DNA repair protein RadA [Clostridia bacterium]